LCQLFLILLIHTGCSAAAAVDAAAMGGTTAIGAEEFDVVVLGAVATTGAG
jgi:hypothetical protein